MKLKRIGAKEINDISLQGVEVVEVQKTDCGILSIRFGDKTGKVIDIRREGNYSDNLQICIQEPPAKIKKYKVVGTALNGLVSVSAVLNTEGEARTKIEESKRLDESADLKVEEIEEIASESTN